MPKGRFPSPYTRRAQGATAASLAAGAHKVHHDQQEALVAEAFAALPGVVKKARRLVRKKR